MRVGIACGSDKYCFLVDFSGRFEINLYICDDALWINEAQKGRNLHK